MAGPSLVEIPKVDKALGIASAEQAKQAQDLQELYKTLGQNFAAQAESARKGTIGNTLETPETVLFKDIQQLKVDQLKANAAASAGMNTDSSVDVMNIMLRDIRDTGLKMRDVTERLAQDKAVSLFDDPLTAIANAFTIPWTEQELKGLEEKQAKSQKTLTELTAGVTNVAAAAENARAKIDAAGIADRQRAISEVMANQAREIEVRGMQSNISGLQAAMTASKEKLALSVERDKWLKSEEAQGFLRQQRELVLLQKQEHLKAIKTVEQAEASRLKYYNIAAAREGLPLLPNVGMMKSRLVTKEEERRFDDMVNRGMLLEDPNSITAKTYSQGDTVGKILEFRRVNGIRPRTDDERTIVQAMVDSKLEADKLEKTPEARDLHATATFRKKMEEWEHVKKDDNSNPLRAPAIETMALSPTVQADPVFQKVIAPLITEGNRKQSAHPEIIGSMVAAAVKDRTVTGNQAVEFLRNFYAQAAYINNEDKDLQKLTGLRQNKFIARLDVGTNVPNALTGLGMMAAAVPTTVFMPITGIALGVAGAATTASATLKTKETYDFTDKTDIQAWLVRKVYANLTKGGIGSPEASGKIEGAK